MKIRATLQADSCGSQYRAHISHMQGLEREYNNWMLVYGKVYFYLQKQKERLYVTILGRTKTNQMNLTVN